jgi:hypothetical protein
MGNPVSAIQQRYVSKDLTHFAGRSKKTPEEQYQLLLQIVRSGELRADPMCAPGKRVVSGRTHYGTARFSNCETYEFPGVCFCDIPLADLAIHARKYSCFGIAFQKQFLVAKGASPVLYLANDSRITVAANHDLGIDNRSYTRKEFFDLMFPRFDGLCSDLAFQARNVRPAPSQAVEELAQTALLVEGLQDYIKQYLLSYCKAFEANRDDDDERHFYMEREWRVLDDVLFAVSDIERLVVPRSFSKQLRDDLPGFYGQTYFLDL